MKEGLKNQNMLGLKTGDASKLYCPVIILLKTTFSVRRENYVQIVSFTENSPPTSTIVLDKGAIPLAQFRLCNRCLV